MISFVTGARLNSLTAHLGHQRVVRAMPNTAVLVGRGFTVWTASDAVSGSSLARVREILNGLGSELYTADEHHIDIATAVSASGPAYAFLLLESWTDAGVFLGLPRDVAQKMAMETIAGSMALREGVRRAQPVLLEPVMDVEVVTPGDYMGDIMGDLSSRRGRVGGMTERGGARVIGASVPLGEMLGYSTSLRSMSQGRAVYTMQFSHYGQVPRSKSEEIVAGNGAVYQK